MVIVNTCPKPLVGEGTNLSACGDSVRNGRGASGHKARSCRCLAHWADGSLFRPQGALAYALLNPLGSKSKVAESPCSDRNKERLQTEPFFILVWVRGFEPPAS